MVDLGIEINVITSVTMINMGLQNLKLTPTILELVDQSTIGPVGKLDDITISVDSWKYRVNLYILHTQSLSAGHPLILGRPWLVTIDDYIGCRYGYMVISNREVTKNIILYPTRTKFVR